MFISGYANTENVFYCLKTVKNLNFTKNILILDSVVFFVAAMNLIVFNELYVPIYQPVKA